MKARISIENIVEKAVYKFCGLAYYTVIMKRFGECNVADDRDFQRAFSHFYRVRQPMEWQKDFYIQFQRLRFVRGLSFAEVVATLNEISGGNRIDISYASKMLHTIDPAKPIYDQFVAKAIGLPKMPTKGTATERLDAASAIYGELLAKSEALLGEEKVRAEIRKFDEIVPSCAWISPMKKLDFLLWSNQ